MGWGAAGRSSVASPTTVEREARCVSPLPASTSAVKVNTRLSPSVVAAVPRVVAMSKSPASLVVSVPSAEKVESLLVSSSSRQDQRARAVLRHFTCAPTIGTPLKART